VADVPRMIAVGNRVLVAQGGAAVAVRLIEAASDQPLALDARFQQPARAATAELQRLMDSGQPIPDKVAVIHSLLHKHKLPP
ncbi:hypothetical protein ABPG75_002517, partial [Micractinium tetrahymenae]